MQLKILFKGGKKKKANRIVFMSDIDKSFFSWIFFA